jgi:hypothetical protein
VTDEPGFSFPVVTDNEIEWAAEALGLPRSAFLGSDRSDPRRLVIKCAESIDVAACPGSGKTTVLVAKLAILASRWAWATRGMCVLSHTNAARSEIGRRLGCTLVGQRLLSYPHFIGTIHGFLNEFLALPWLRAQGYPIRVIDNSVCQERVWRRLDPKTRSALEKRRMREGDLVACDVRFSPGSRGGKFPCGETTPTYQATKAALEVVAREGYFRHDDTLIWADDLLDRRGSIVGVLRERFPIVFIDEAQDNSEEQAAILNRIFGGTGDGVVKQRLGDSNQAVFGSGQAEIATTDAFPLAAKRRDLPDSYRFGQAVADLADSFGIQPYSSGFVGRGPCGYPQVDAAKCPHTIFLFDKGRLTAVLDAYGQLLVDTFPEEVLRDGTFVAVSQVHNNPEQLQEQNRPYGVQDYWPQYDPTSPRIGALPRTLNQYIVRGVSEADAAGCTSAAVEGIAEGILRLASTVAPEVSRSHHRYCHRHICACLAASGDALNSYLNMVHEIAAQRVPIDQGTWENKWREKARVVASALAGAPVVGNGAERFLSFGSQVYPPDAMLGRSRANVYGYPHDKPRVEIEVGSIHSVKGQTHTATLAMESFWNGHNLESLREWVLDPLREWREGDGVRRKTRLRLHYVAMTRPTHLVCLAMRRGAFEDTEGRLDPVQMQTLAKRGWQVVEV